MTQLDHPEIQDLLAIAARLGQDPRVIQGPGGNISIKRDGILWVKASGTWMINAMAQPILTPVDLAAVRAGLEAGDPSCETCSDFVRHDLLPSPLRPSIETTLHAVMVQKVVLHVHCVETIAQACLSDAPQRLATALKGLDWIFVPYVRPGVSLAREMARRLRRDTDVVVLGNHGLVVAGNSAAEAAELRAEVSRRLARSPRAFAASNVERASLLGFEGAGYRMAKDDALHAMAIDPAGLAVARRGSLYPDHVVFLGPGILETQGAETAADAARRVGRPAAPLVVVPRLGVLMHDDASASAHAMARCLADVTSRLSGDDPIVPLTAEDEADLLDWDAEKYRQSLDKRPS
jgi:rhamnose utilization protein RhaD (predicted bifunctional aldolase and dehydrogenase)